MAKQKKKTKKELAAEKPKVVTQLDADPDPGTTPPPPITDPENN